MAPAGGAYAHEVPSSSRAVSPTSQVEAISIPLRSMEKPHLQRSPEKMMD
jgi:hypothetical protein